MWSSSIAVVSGASVRVQGVSRCRFLLQAKAAFQRVCQTMFGRSTLSRSCVRNECCITSETVAPMAALLTSKSSALPTNDFFLKIIWTTVAFQVALQAYRSAVFVASQTEFSNIIVCSSGVFATCSCTLERFSVDENAQLLG